MKGILAISAALLFLGAAGTPVARAAEPAAGWAGPDRFIVLSTVAGFDGSARGGDVRPNPYAVVRDAYGPFEGRSIAIGVAPMFRVFQADMDVLSAALRNHLRLARETRVPVFICLSTFVFNTARPDLWNWWDPGAPGYDPDNVHHVEWTGWSPASAVKIGWLNWGSQMRLPPMPNLMSPKFQAAMREAFTTLGSIVKEWHDALPEEDRWLFIGFRSTDEVAMGVNNWHYPDGNRYVGQDPADDPRTGIDPSVLPSRGVQTIGYSAVRSAGLRSSGELTMDDINEVCRRHCEYSSRLLFDLGFPRDKIFSSSFGKTVRECSTCLTPYSCPSWSFYQTSAIRPDGYVAALEALAVSDAPVWAMAEWGIGRNARSSAYRTGLGAGLALSGCRFIRLTGEWFGHSPRAVEPEPAAALKSLIR